MLYELNFEKIPRIISSYTVTRRTVWQIADPYHILIYIQDGECTIECNNSLYQLKSGDVFFIPAMQLYTRRPFGEGTCTLSYIHFTQELLGYDTEEEAARKILAIKEKIDAEVLHEGAEASVLTSAYIPTHLVSHKDLLEYFDKIEKTFSKKRVESHLLSSALLFQMLTKINECTLQSLFEAGVTAALPSIPHKLKKAILYIRANATREITLSELSRICAVSKQQLIRYFKSELNTTPSAYITALRINRAKEMLLTQPHLLMKEIGEEVGYEDQHYFTRVFIKVTGETPSQYKYRIHHYTPDP